MHAGQFGASNHMLKIGAFVEEADIIGNCAGHQMIVLHHHADIFTENIGADCGKGGRHRSGSRRSSPVATPRITFSNVVLPPPERPGNGDVIAGGNPEGNVLEDERFAGGIPVGEVAHLEMPLDRAWVKPVLFPQDGSGSAWAMSESRSRCRSSMREIDRLLHQPRGLGDELLLIGDERKQHADRHPVRQHRMGANRDDHNILDARIEESSQRGKTGAQGGISPVSVCTDSA